MSEERSKEVQPPDKESSNPTNESMHFTFRSIGDNVTNFHKPEEHECWFIKLFKCDSCWHVESIRMTNSKGKIQSWQSGIVEREVTQRTVSVKLTLADSQKSLQEAPVENKTSSLLEFSTQHQKEHNYTFCERFLLNFKDIQVIGSGGFGTVFKARQLLDEKVYAIKRVQLPDNRERVLREVKTLAVLQHKNILQYHTSWTGKDVSYMEEGSSNSSPGKEALFEHLFIQTEFCERGTLEDWIDQRKWIGNYKDESLAKYQQIVEAVEYMHLKNIFHRDLKPANIFLTSEDKIKLGDFGLATSGGDDLAMERTADMGTPSYRAPEQEETTYGKEVDLFSLGLLCFEMLHPFNTKMEKRKKWEDIRKGLLPSEFTDKFPAEALIIQSLLAKEPSKRLTIAVLLEFLNQNEKKLSPMLPLYVIDEPEVWHR